MSSRISFLLALLLSLLQFALPVNAKGGGKGSGSKSSNKGSKSKSTPKYKSGHVAYREGGNCYDDQYATQHPSSSSFLSLLYPRHVQISCPADKTNLIITIVLGGICGNFPFIPIFLRPRAETSKGLLLLVALALYLKGRWKEKKSLDEKDEKSTVPLVQAESKETDNQVFGCRQLLSKYTLRERSRVVLSKVLGPSALVVPSDGSPRISLAVSVVAGIDEHSRKGVPEGEAWVSTVVRRLEVALDNLLVRGGVSTEPGERLFVVSKAGDSGADREVDPDIIIVEEESHKPPDRVRL
ncbi:hypothetical protein BJ322DRAFT_1221773 [Thelephora terrestris]|uniref:Uncharacterized protein n=1 Tax=Thelephora terrestris TaxID=56493 RepID=A0A9P6L1M2_9AGAM|nr:hypothetical protein BJ322DRAFT_1221773 [Thelephora terrestris]